MNISPIRDDAHVLNNEIFLSPESSELLQKLKKIPTGHFFRKDRALAKKFENVDPIELTDILKVLFMEMVENDEIKDPIKFIDRLARIIPLAKLEEAVDGDACNALSEAIDMFDEAKHYLDLKQCNMNPKVRTHISTALDGAIAVVENLITVFGIGEFFRPAYSDIQGDYKSQKIKMCFTLFTMISTFALPLLGAATAGLVIGGILFTIAAISLIWPYIKPITFHLPANAKNWTKEVQSGTFIEQGRKESLDEIANILKTNRHAILVGPSRVGKSMTAKSFAQAVERGDYPELQGKVVFHINTSDLIGQKSSHIGSENYILNKISNVMGRHRNDIILVLDEIHMACKNNEKLADQLKTFLDEGGAFPHVIGITTEEEYSHVKDNNAFSLRFDRVDIENTSQDETLKILSDTILRSPSNPLIEEGVLHHIYDKSCEVRDAPQPAASIRLLKRCINRTEKTQKSRTEKKIIEVSNEILSLRSQAAAIRGRKNDRREKMAELERQLKGLQELARREKMELKKLFKSKDLLDRVTKETYTSILKISAIGQKTLNAKNVKQLKRFLLLHEFLNRSLESHIVDKSSEMKIKLMIDDALVDEVANEEVANELKRYKYPFNENPYKIIEIPSSPDRLNKKETA